MATYTEKKNKEYDIPNITVFNKYCDGEHCAFRVVPDKGYVMYDSKSDDYEQQIDADGNPVFDKNDEPVSVKVTYYYRQSNVPLTRPNRPYDWVAVLEETIDKNYIF